MKRVLYVHGGLLNMGGTEAVMMNYYRNFDRKQLQVDFVLHGFGEGAYDEEVINMGGNIFHVVPKGENFAENAKQLREIIENGEYVAVHAHMDAGNAQVLKIAKECGVPVRVSHSHNTAVQTSNPLKKIFNELEKKKISKYATHLFACSDLAGKWLYGNHEFTLINNAVDANKFNFSQSTRDEMREKLGISNDTVLIGHVGRFSYQKNHEKLILIFADYLKVNSNAKLMLIGEGETKDAVKEQCKALKIEDSVIFILPNQEIYKYMQAMDCFLMPSRFEGLPVVAVEAQAAGLPVILADTVSEKTAITNLVSFVSLDANADAWNSEIDNAIKCERTNRLEEMKLIGFDIAENAKKMQNFYITGEMNF